MKQVFKYGKMDKRARQTTILSIVALAAILSVVWYFWGEGGYAMAWFISLAVAVTALFVLSIPRSIEITPAALDIKCIVEITHIPLRDIRGIRRVEAVDMKKMVCLLGSPGFFGYFGIYLDVKRMEFVRLYCNEWDNFVEITDIYEKRFYVSTPESDRLIRTLSSSVESGV